jgi:hypothetical protein
MRERELRWVMVLAAGLAILAMLSGCAAHGPAPTDLGPLQVDANDETIECANGQGTPCPKPAPIPVDWGKLLLDLGLLFGTAGT